MIPIPVAIIGLMLTAVFSAGGAIVTLRFLQKDINGLGRRVRNIELAFAVIAVLEKEDRMWLATFLQR